MNEWVPFVVLAVSLLHVLMAALTAYADSARTSPRVAEAILFPPLGITLASLMLTAHAGMVLLPYYLLWLVSALMCSYIVRSFHRMGRERHLRKMDASRALRRVEESPAERRTANECGEFGGATLAQATGARAGITPRSAHPVINMGPGSGAHVIGACR